MDKMIPLYVNQVMAGKTRQERRQILERVPWRIRDRVKAEVDYRWQERRQASTRSR